MATKHCFTPVTIAPGAGVPGYTIMTVPADPAANGLDIPYDVDQVYVEYAPVGEGPATSIKFFKFEVGNTAPKYIAKHDDDYAVAVDDVVIGATNTYLVMRKDGDGILGGSKSSRKGRKSARKGRKSARKSRRARGSRSKK